MALTFYNEALQESLALLETDPDNDTLQKNVLTFKNNIGIIYILKEEFDTALDYFEKLLSEINKTDHNNLIVVLGNLSYIHINMDNYDKALDYNNRKLKINRETGDRNNEARSVMYNGNINYYKGDMKSALKNYKEAYQINLEVGNKVTGARCANNLASVYQKIGEYENAVDYFQKSLLLKEELGDKNGIAATCGNIGIVYNDWGNQEKALEYYTKSMGIYLETGNKSGLAGMLNNIGNVFIELNQADSALKYFNRAIVLCDSTGNRNIKVHALVGVGSVYAELNMKYDEALQYFLDAKLLAEEINSGFWVANCKANLGKVNYETGNFPKALKNLEEAFNYSHENNAHELLSESHLYLSKVYEAMGYPTKSLAHFKAYTQINDSIFNADKARIVSELQTKYETEKKEKENLNLNKENEIQHLKLDNQRTIIYLMTAGILVAVALLSMVYFLYRKRTIAYKNLVTKNLELAQCDRKILESGEIIPESLHKMREENTDDSAELSKDIELIEKLNIYFGEEKPYLYSNINIEDVSAQIGSNRTYLSKAINNVFNKSFNTLINEFRIRAARQLMTNNKYDHISLEGIGQMVGYNSRTVFYNNFKKVTGLTPSYFRESIGT